jgi:hypothetical protein
MGSITFEVKLPSACSFIVGKARKHAHKNMEINGNTTKTNTN